MGEVSEQNLSKDEDSSSDSDDTDNGNTSE